MGMDAAIRALLFYDLDGLVDDQLAAFRYWDALPRHVVFAVHDPEDDIAALVAFYPACERSFVCV